MAWPWRVQDLRCSSYLVPCLVAFNPSHLQAHIVGRLLYMVDAVIYLHLVRYISVPCFSRGNRGLGHEK